MLLTNVRLLPEERVVDIAVNGEMISAVSDHAATPAANELTLNFQHVLAFPGLINSHDHLDFDCFPALENSKYNNYTEWGADIHARYKEEINAVLKIPAAQRAAWGLYKNLLSGVTTVVNHGDLLSIEDPLITVRQDFQSLHSVAFQKNWKLKLNNPVDKNKICVMHVGEGTDDHAKKEIDELTSWNLWHRKLVAVHAVAMNESQAKKFEAIVWCPESNMFLLNTMPDIKKLKKHTAILFGTDSTLTGDWNMWNHLRLARNSQHATDEELFNMLTKTAAKVWGMNSGEIATGKQANIVITKNKTGDFTWDDFYNTQPKDILMVIHKGNISMFDSSLLPQLESMDFDTSKFSAVNLNHAVKFVEGDLPALMRTIRGHYSKAVFPTCETDVITV